MVDVYCEPCNPHAITVAIEGQLSALGVGENCHRLRLQVERTQALSLEYKS